MPTHVQHPAHATTAQFFSAADSTYQSQGTDGLGITRTGSLGASEQQGGMVFPPCWALAPGPASR